METKDLIGSIDEMISRASEISDEKITRNEDSLDFIEPRNPTDPIVVFDPTMGFSNIVVRYYPQNEDENSAGNPDPTQNMLKEDAIRFPLIKLNNKVIDKGNIIKFSLYLRNFLPEISLVINDLNGTIQTMDVPGLNNVITIILIAPVEGANKKISMDFYITKCTFNGDQSITYEGEYKLIDLKQIKNLQLGQDKLNTYEYLQEIAKDCKLGFAATNNCKDIEDKEWRQIYSQTYIQFIDNTISYGGLDENSIFDTWIDEFGYLVLVNVPYVMNETVDVKQLTTKVIYGITNTEPNEISPKQEVKEVIRMISNSNALQSVTNLAITTYNSIVNTKDTMNTGTLNGYYCLTSPCDQNLIEYKQLQVVEMSVDGIEGVDEYKYETMQFLGVNQNDDGNPLVQGEIRKNYFNKLYSRQLEVTLDIANYSLQRGTLIQVMIFEFDKENKRRTLDNYDRAYSTKQSELDEVQSQDQELLQDDANGVPNPALSGIYYIHNIEFFYVDGYENIKQRLTLVKKGIQSNLTNKYAPAKLFKNNE